MSDARSTRFVWLLLALTLFVAFAGIGRMDVVTDNEGQRATPPAEMVRSGHYLIPTINGKDYLAKPPLLYWAIAGAYKLTGKVSPISARAPTAASYVALVLCMYVLVRKETGEMPARWGALALLASPYVIERARWASLDVPLTLATFLAVLAFRAACASDNARRTAAFTLGSGIALGAAMLLKGPAPLLFMAAAWLAYMIVSARDTGVLLRHGTRATFALISLALVLWVVGPIAPVRFPVALVLFLAAWTWLALRHTRVGPRPLAVLAAAVAIGLVVAAPWCLAVLRVKGWAYCMALLNDQALTRTYAATRINSGTPIFYIVGLPVILAPWGLLLPFHVAKGLWGRASSLYKFSLVAGWLSVLTFSLIAGKEYEYILPAVPFLLIPTGRHLADLAQPSIAKWGNKWRDGMIVFLAFMGVGSAVYVTVAQSGHPALLVQAWLLGLGAAGLGFYGRRHAPHRLACIFCMALCVILIGMMSRAYHYTGQRSYKAIATATGGLLRAGHEVEAVKMTSAFDVFPAFAFYARTHVPTTLDLASVHRKMRGDTPYYCVLRQEILDNMSEPLPPGLAVPLMGPHTRKDLVVIGNRPMIE